MGEKKKTVGSLAIREIRHPEGCSSRGLGRFFTQIHHRRMMVQHLQPLLFFLTPQPNSKKQSQLLCLSPLTQIRKAGETRYVVLVWLAKSPSKTVCQCHLCQQPLKEIGEGGGRRRRRRGSVWTLLDDIYSVFGDKYEEDMYSLRAEDQRNRLASSSLSSLTPSFYFCSLLA